MERILALDFETADHRPDSACAIGLALVEGDAVEAVESHLIRPPYDAGPDDDFDFTFTWVHGITWARVAAAPDFRRLWRSIRSRFHGVGFLAAHNAGFDRGVLAACCRAHGIEAPSQPFVCTMRLAREVWGIRPTRLPDVCRRLGIRLGRHHDAAADAEACARIMIAAAAAGWRPGGNSTASR